jgi:hypothetical protein
MPHDDFQVGDDSQLAADIGGICTVELAGPALADAGGKAGLRTGSDVSLLGVENGLDVLKRSNNRVRKSHSVSTRV